MRAADRSHPNDTPLSSLARTMVLTLPGFGTWAGRVREFDTPFGHAGIRQLEVLYLLRHNLLNTAQPTATQIADHFGVQPSVITRIVQKLIAADYLTRQQCGHDGRAWTLAITERGRNLSDYVELEFFREMETALVDMDAGDLERLRKAMGILEQVAARLHTRLSEHLAGEQRSDS